MEDMEINKMNEVMSGCIPYSSSFYVKEYNNFVLPKIICSIATSIGSEGFNIDDVVSAYEYKNIRLKTNINKALTEDAKNILGIVLHKSIKSKKYVVNMDIIELFDLLGIKQASLMKNRNHYMRMLSDYLLELRSFSISCNMNGKEVGGGLIIMFEVNELTNKVNVIVDPTFFELHDNDKFHLSGDIKKFNSSKSDMHSALLKLFISNNFKKYSVNSLFMQDVYYTLNLDMKNRSSRTVLKRVLDKMVKDDILVSYEFKKVGFAPCLFFTLKKQVPVITDQSNKSVPNDNKGELQTYPEFDEEVEYIENEPVSEDSTKTIDLSIIDDDLPF